MQPVFLLCLLFLPTILFAQSNLNESSIPFLTKKILHSTENFDPKGLRFIHKADSILNTKTQYVDTTKVVEYYIAKSKFGLEYMPATEILESLNTAIELAEQAKDTLNYLRSINQLARSHIFFGDKIKAEYLLKQGLIYDNVKQYPDVYCDLLHNYGLIQFKKYDKTNNIAFVDSAASYFNREIIIAYEHGFSKKLTLAFNNLGRTYYLKNELDSVAIALNHAVSLANEKDNYTRAIILDEYAHSYFLPKQKYDSAITYLTQSLALLPYSQKTIGAKKTIYLNLYKTYKQIGKEKEAYQTLLKIQQLSDSLDYYTLQKNLDFQNIKLELDKSESQLLSKINTLEFSQNLKDRQVLIRNILIAIVVVFLFGLVMIYNNYSNNKTYLNELEKSSLLIEEKNELLSQQSEELNKINQEINTLNSELEGKFKIRTHKIEQQSKQLFEYSFANSHKIRGPLSSMLGLLNLYHGGMLRSEEEIDFLIDGIQAKSKEIDAVLHSMNAKLHDIDESSLDKDQMANLFGGSDE